MPTSLSDPIFNDEDAARAHMEAIRWPNGPFCPHCGGVENITRLEGKSHRPGLFQCNACREHFTVTVGSVMERSHIPLQKWVLGFHLMSASKKGMSANQLGRMLGLTYKSAWFMAHRIREAMSDPTPSPLGGENKVVEADETYIGGKEGNKHKHKRTPGRQGGGGKAAVFSLVEREGHIRSFHVANVTSETLRPIMVKAALRSSYLMTDESKVYPKVGEEFAGHGTVNHSAEEYVRGKFWHTNTAENAFSILKRGIYGNYHHVSEAHLHRYLSEFDFRRNHRSGLGLDDDARAAAAIKGADGKRLLYKGSSSTANVQAEG